MGLRDGDRTEGESKVTEFYTYDLKGRRVDLSDDLDEAIDLVAGLNHADVGQTVDIYHRVPDEDVAAACVDVEF